MTSRIFKAETIDLASLESTRLIRDDIREFVFNLSYYNYEDEYSLNTDDNLKFYFSKATDEFFDFLSKNNVDTICGKYSWLSEDCISNLRDRLPTDMPSPEIILNMFESQIKLAKQVSFNKGKLVIQSVVV